MKDNIRLNVKRELVVVAILVGIVPGMFLAFSEIQVLSVYHYLGQKFSPDIAARFVTALVLLATMLLSAIFYWRHVLGQLWNYFCNIVINMSKKKFIACVVLFLLIGRLLVLCLDYSPVTDGLWFHQAATSLSENNIFGPKGSPSAYRFPGYQFLLSLTYRLFGSHLILTWCWGLFASLLTLIPG